MMEWPDDLKVDWASPVVIMDNGDHMEALVLIWQGFYYHAQCTLEMFNTIVSKPVVPFFCHAHRKKAERFPICIGTVSGVRRAPEPICSCRIPRKRT